MIEFDALPSAKSCRLIDFDKADLVAGAVPNSWILVVTGTKPWLNMEIRLSPLIYVTQPEYWGIEVVGCLPGIGLPAEAPYHITLPIQSWGSMGIEVLGAAKSKKIQIPK